MIRRIDHIAIAVRDLAQAKSFFIDGLGGRELFSFPLTFQKFRWTTIELGTSCFIELIDPLEEDSFVHRFLEKRGEGPHHITIQVDDIHETRKMLEERGIHTFGFSEELPGWKEFFIHPKDACGALIQFAEFNPLDWINPGYIPRSYREFVLEQKIGPEGDHIEVRRVECVEGAEIEMQRGGETFRIPEGRVGELIQALERSIRIFENWK
jgi:methylmalonyl-CoA epimerase